MSLIKGMHHAALKCLGTEQFERTVSFYRDLLGLRLVRTWGSGTDAGAMLDCGDGTLIELFANAEQQLPQGTIRHIALATDDPDAAIEAMRAAGYAITEEPHDIVIPSDPPFPARIAFAIGPVGEEIEFFCEK